MLSRSGWVTQTLPWSLWRIWTIWERICYWDRRRDQHGDTQRLQLESSNFLTSLREILQFHSSSPHKGVVSYFFLQRMGLGQFAADSGPLMESVGNFSEFGLHYLNKIITFIIPGTFFLEIWASLLNVAFSISPCYWFYFVVFSLLLKCCFSEILLHRFIPLLHLYLQTSNSENCLNIKAILILILLL